MPYILRGSNCDNPSGSTYDKYRMKPTKAKIKALLLDYHDEDIAEQVAEELANGYGEVYVPNAADCMKYELEKL